MPVWWTLRRNQLLTFSTPMGATSTWFAGWGCRSSLHIYGIPTSERSGGTLLLAREQDPASFARPAGRGVRPYEGREWTDVGESRPERGEVYSCVTYSFSLR